MKKIAKILLLIVMTIGTLSCKSWTEREQERAIKVLKPTFIGHMVSNSMLDILGLEVVEMRERYSVEIEK